MIFAIDRQSVVPDSLGTAAHLLRLHGADPGRAGAGPRAGHRRDRLPVRPSGSSTSLLREAIDADYINFLVGNEVGIARQRPRRPRADGADDLPTAGHLRRQAGGGRQCPSMTAVTIEPIPGVSQARSDPRGRRRAPHASAASPPSTSTTSRCSGARSPRSSAPTAPARRRSSTCSPASTSPNRGQWTFDGASLAGVPAYKVARRGMVRTFQLTKSLARLSVLENMKLGATGQRGEGFFAALARPLWSAQEREITERGRRAARAVQARPHARRVRRRRCRAASASCSRWRGR